MQSQGNIIRYGLLIAIAFLVAGTASAQIPSWYNQAQMQGVEPGIPDFYQHQGATNSGTAGINEGNQIIGFGGLCFQTSFEDAVYYWATLNPTRFGGLYPQPGNWVANMVNDNAAITAGGNLSYLTANHGTYVANSLVATQYNNTGANGYIYNLYQTDLFAGADVLVYITDPNPSPANGNKWWWDGSYHVLEGVGVDNSGGQTQIVFADPDNTIYAPNSQDGMAVQRTDNSFGQYLNANWPAAGASNNYNRSYTTNDPLPIGTGWANVGANQYYQEAAVGATGNITSGIYAGCTISAIYAITPEPSTVLLLGAGIVSLLLYAWRRRRAMV